MPSVASSGTQSGQTIGVEVTLATLAANGNYVCAADLTNLQSGDVLALNIYDQIIGGAGYTLVYQQIFSGAQTPPGQMSVPISVTHSAQYRLNQTAGTARSIPWEVRQL